ncbi:MAG: ribosomal-processing cysteine protease Prp [Clostridia bacterium]
MTNITINKVNGNIVKVVCVGHTGYAQSGQDIVCAGISTLVQTALLGILNVACVNVDYTIRADDGLLEFTIDNNPDHALNEAEMHDCQIILKTMLCGLSDFNTEYSDYMNLEVIE